jgi:hypothetical protein
MTRERRNREDVMATMELLRGLGFRLIGRADFVPSEVEGRPSVIFGAHASDGRIERLLAAGRTHGYRELTG